MKTAYAIVVGLIIGLLSGVGVVHVSLAGDVKEHGVKITRIEKDMDIERSRTDERVFELVGLVKEVLKTHQETMQDNRELKALVRAQMEQQQRGGGSGR